jgi:hypothetical protein
LRQVGQFVGCHLEVASGGRSERAMILSPSAPGLGEIR